MKLLQKLREALAKALKDQEAILAKTIDDKGVTRAMSPEENTQYETLETSIKDLKVQIERAKQVADDQDEVEKTRKTTNGAPTISITKDEDEDDKGNYRGFDSLGEFLKSVRNVERGVQDDRFEKIRAAAGMNEAVGVDGGFLLQTDFTSTLTEKAFENADIASRCREIPISNASNSIEIQVLEENSRADGSRNGGVAVYWGAEAATYLASKPKTRLDKLELQKLMGLFHATDEQIEDTVFLGAWMNELFGDEFGFKLDSSIIEGLGGAFPLGVKNSDALVSVSKKSGQAADTVVAENILAMDAQLLPRSQGTAIWLINQEVKAQLPAMTIGDQPVYMPPGGLTGASYGTLLGKEVVVCESCEKLGDAGDIYLFDPKQYYVARKGGIKGAASIHVKFLTGEQSFRYTLRVNGQPALKTAVTPYKGTSGKKLSAYLTVENRT